MDGSSKITALLQQMALQPLRLETIIALRRLDRALRQTPQAQERVLMSILRRSRKSRYGILHNFSRLGGVDDFRAAVPIGTYDDFAPYIEQIKRGDASALFSPGERIHMFALTSGTTGPAKYIPVTDEFLRGCRRGWHIWGLQMYADHQAAVGASVLQLASRIDEEITQAGTPCGAISGLTAKMQPSVVRSIYAVPLAACEAGDTESKYYLTVRLGLMRRSIVPLTANPSTLIGLARLMDRRKEELIRDVADGTLTANLNLPTLARSNLESRLRPLPRLAKELEQSVTKTGVLYPKDAWKIPLIGTWKGGTLKIYLEQLEKYFGAAPVRDIGLIASEGRASIPMSDEGASGVLDVEGCFFEFLPADAGQFAAANQSAQALLAHEVEPGRTYSLVMTTHCGLFRYNIGDQVRIVGFAHRAPIIEFLGRGSAVSSLAGEKLTEFQVISAVNEAVKCRRLPVTNYVLCPSWSAQAPYYSLLVEEDEAGMPEAARLLAAEIDQRLTAANIEYAGRRASGRLGPVRIKVLPQGALSALDARLMAARSHRPEQYKHRFLENSVEFEKKFEIRSEIGEPAESEIS